LRTHSHKEQLKDLEHLHVTQTVTTEELRFPTLCNLNITILKQSNPSGLLFYCLCVIIWGSVGESMFNPNSYQ